jgi:hypothetical protein
MKKLTTLLGVVALSTTFAVAGCKKKEDQVAPAAKAAEPAPPPAETPPAPTPAAEVKPVEGQPAAGETANNLPPECADYKATIEKLGSCEKVPAAQRDQLKQTLDKDLMALTAPDADKVKAASNCKTAMDAIKTKHGKNCGL